MPTRTGPLAGLVVLDITRVVAGPFCSMLLADLGATVIKVEHPDEPDYARTFPPFVGDEGEQAQRVLHPVQSQQAGHHAQPEIAQTARRFCKKLVRRADVLVENFRPGTMDKLGLGYEVLQAGESEADLHRDQRLRPHRAERVASLPTTIPARPPAACGR